LIEVLFLPLYLDKEKMSKRIIYPTDNGGVAIIVPASEWLAQEGNTIEILAAKDVPEGKPYKIIDTTDVPSDRTFRNAWEYTA
jgi:hypothetical protein